MYTNTLLAMSGALLSVVAAVPMADSHHHHHHKKDYVWVKHTEVVYETIPITKTVWVEPGRTMTESQSSTSATSYPSSSSQAVPVNKAPAPAYHAPAPPAYSAPSPPAYSAPAPPAYSPPPPPAHSAPAPPAYNPPTTTSQYVAPAPEAPAPTYVAPPTYAAPPPASSSAPAPAPSSPESSGGSGHSSGLTGMAAPGQTYTGDLTWYDVGLGSCGITNTPNQHVVAISHTIFDAYGNGNPNKNPLCGSTVSITGKDGQKHQATIVDRCVGCAAADLDLSQDFFNAVTNNGDGRVHGMDWCFD